MSDLFIRLRIAILVVLGGLTLVVLYPVISITQLNSEYLTVRFLDVGQGDAIHIMTPDGYEMLIDGGPTAQVLREFSKDRSFFDHSIDIVVSTHPDTDHIAGLVDILERYSVDWLVGVAAKSNSPAALAYEKVAQVEGAHRIIAQAGQTIQLGASTTVKILSPLGDTTNWQSNNASVVIQVVYGDTEFMLTGDAPSTIEEYLVSTYGEDLESEVLKLGHHGSKTASSEIFLQAVHPQYAVVSAGLDNRYGHPNKTVVERVAAQKIELVNTAVVGTITFKSDGERVWIE